MDEQIPEPVGRWLVLVFIVHFLSGLGKKSELLIYHNLSSHIEVHKLGESENSSLAWSKHPTPPFASSHGAWPGMPAMGSPIIAASFDGSNLGPKKGAA